ncbi:MAG TPA: DUF2779 domain-containing protein, partial [Bacteroidia bacterium]|nr:DUF2779 domain-containing protein [Bacteroidia bacterium]
MKDAVSPAQQAIFDKGIEVGLLARKLFAEGVDASPSENFNYSKAVISTQELLNKNTSIIYEATFQYDELLTASDILVNDNGKWKCYEVKSSTQIKDVFLLDAAFQYF